MTDKAKGIVEAIKEAFEVLSAMELPAEEQKIEITRDAAMTLIAQLEQAEPVRHGYWIPQDNTHTKFMCSDCKGRNHDGSGKYCSECGCKMDAEVNNDGSNSAEY